MSVDVGDGHRAVADALACALRARQSEVACVDPVHHDRSSIMSRLFRTYPATIRYVPAAQAVIYGLLSTRVGFAAFRAPFTWQARSTLSNLIQETDADVVVPVHPGIVPECSAAIERSGRPRGLVPVVCDLAAFHRGWVEGKIDRLLAPTEIITTAAQRHGMPDDQMRLIGYPVRPGFVPSDPATRASLRRSLGLAGDEPVLLVTGGGEGAGRMSRTVSALTRAGAGWQVVAVCGRNERLRRHLTALRAGLRAGSRLTVLGHVNIMADLMRASDLMLGKAGSATIAEAMATALPIVLTGHVPGQETPNVGYLTGSGCGVHVPKPREVVPTVATLLSGDRKALRGMVARARAVTRPAAEAAAAECLRIGERYRQ